MSSKATNYRDILDQKQYLKLMLANIVSRFGDSLDAIAFSWIMYEVTKSASMIALIMALNYLPNVFLQPFLGVLAERYSKKKIMALCDLGRGTTVVLTAILFMLNWLTPLMLIGITLLNSTLESVRMPAGNAILPHILDKEKYTIGTALSQTLGRISELVGMGLAGGIIALWGSWAALLIDAGTFVFSAAVISFIKYTEVLEKEPLRLKSFAFKLVDGFKYLRSNRMLFLLILLGAFINFSVAPLTSFQSIYVADILKMGPEILSLMGIALTVGMGLGAFVMPKLMKLVKNRTLLFICGGLESAAMFGFWIIPSIKSAQLVLLALGGVLLFLGVGVGIINVIFSAAFTTNVNPDYLARVSAITNALLCSISPIAAFLCSALAAFFTVPAIFFIFGTVHIIVYAAAAFIKEYHEL